MHKLIAPFTLAMVLALAACGGPLPDNQTEGGPPEEQTPAMPVDETAPSR
jgi:predicted small lipoprotein YifL